MIELRDLTKPYSDISYEGISYSSCKEFSHISRYRTLRQVVHSPNSVNRFVTLETPNPFTSHTNVLYHDVTVREENRLDLIAQTYLGSATYAWVIAYFNSIEDGFTVLEGQRIMIPKNISSLFETGEVLQPRSAIVLNLGEE